MINKQKQSGLALLLFMIILIGMGGVMAEGYMKNIAKEVKQTQYLKNQKVLEEAKRALLQYAFNYPEISGQGPGRLPCPDTDDNGVAETSLNCSNGGPLVGRFPALQTGLNSENLKDSSGNSLWYAVSHTFSRNKGAPDVINDNSLGAITIRDTIGNVLYDGSANAGGVAAVIIAPGEPITRADGHKQVRIKQGEPDPSSDRINPDNYLDVGMGEDNSSFVLGDRNSSNGVSDGDGFIIGPVFDSVSNSFIVNDQVIVITSDELKKFAFDRVMVELTTVFDDYYSKVTQYPWLYDADYSDGAFNFSNPVTGDLYDIEAGGALKGQVPMLVNNKKFGTDLQFKWELSSSVPVSNNGVGEIVPNDLKIFDQNFPVSSYMTERCTWRDSYKINCDTTISLAKWQEELSANVWTDCSGDETSCSAGVHVRKYTLSAIDDIDFSGTSITTAGYLPASLTETARVNIEIKNSDIDSVLQAQKFPVILQISQYVDKSISIELEIVSLDLTPSIIYSATGTDFIALQTRYFPQGGWFAKNYWQNYIVMEYTDGEKPGGSGLSCTVGTDCIEVTERLNKSVINNAEVIVVASGTSLKFQSRDSANIDDYFEGDNNNDITPYTYTDRELNGNDRVVILKP